MVRAACHAAERAGRCKANLTCVVVRGPDKDRTTEALPVGFPAHLRDASLRAWFDERVRPLVFREAEEGAGGRWEAVEDGLTDGALAGFEERMREEGAPARAALTIFAGWSAGYVAGMIAAAVLRDGVLVRTSRPGALQVLRHLGGWYGDVRLGAAEAVVAVGHPWSARRDVVTVADQSALEAEAITEITRVCTPIIEAIAERSQRGRAGLWAQVADGIGSVAFLLCEVEPQLAPAAVVAATERLLRTPGAPWRQRHVPRFWMAQTSGDPVLVQHRGSCCLFYRFEPHTDVPAEDGEPDRMQVAYVERFGEEPPHYCATCLFRKPEDVEARLVFSAEYERTARD